MQGVQHKRRQARIGAAALGLALAALPAFASSPAAPAAAPVRPAAPAEQSRPNFLVIMGDDIGYSDIGAYGGNIDRSEEHTSELQSLTRNSYAVFCLTKKKSKNHTMMQN